MGDGDEDNKRLIVLSFRGLDKTMIDNHPMRNLKKLRVEGVTTTLDPTYYETLFDNCFCIATGICPAKILFDSKANDTDAYKKTQYENIEDGRLSGIFMWPTIKGHQYGTEESTHYIKYDEDSKMYNNIEKFLKWINNNKKSNLLMAHIDVEKAYKGHDESQNYPLFVDDLFGSILKELGGNAELKKKMNLIVLTCTQVDQEIYFIASGSMFQKNTVIAFKTSLEEVYVLLEHILLNVHEKANSKQPKGRMNEIKNVLVSKHAKMATNKKVTEKIKELIFALETPKVT